MWIWDVSGFPAIRLEQNMLASGALFFPRHVASWSTLKGLDILGDHLSGPSKWPASIFPGKQIVKQRSHIALAATNHFRLLLCPLEKIENIFPVVIDCLSNQKRTNQPICISADGRSSHR